MFFRSLYQVHADIKPDNIIIVNNILKITDLGLAFGLPWMRQATRRPVVRGTIGRYQNSIVGKSAHSYFRRLHGTRSFLPSNRLQI